MRPIVDADRNLLFGVLALQADLIDQAQLAEACAAWAARKDTSLADLLIERGWLTGQDRADVDRLLERKLKKRGGDIRNSLAAVADDAVRHSLAAVTDSDIQGVLATLAPPAQAIPPPTFVQPVTHRQHYLLAHLHATGGIGRVWLARDQVLGRDVALKELRPDRTSHPEFQARFRQEACITGQLEHPGIVPVYELVDGPDSSSLFYTMRFVKGRTLSEVIQEFHRQPRSGADRPLTQHTLLNAFVGVCNAVAFAHARGILHRDLKSPNIVLGEFGEVIVLDWGLAKRIDQKDDSNPTPPIADGPTAANATLEGQVVGTPAYMSPEQAEGRLSRMDQRTDVYGLGAILYEVLTGQPPFIGADPMEVLQRVRREEPARPCQVCADVPAALEAVCLKALARDPAQRYASAAELGREVQRWLADEPVTAHREPLAARAGRWARRHRAVVSGLAALMLTGLVALSVATLLLGREKARTEKARAQAVANFRLARDAVDRSYTQVSENRLLNEPGLQPLRKELLQTAQEFYQKFYEQQKDDPEVQADLGKALVNLGRITGEIDSKTRAIELLDEARSIFERLEHRRELARCFNLLGTLHRAQGQTERAEAAYGRAVEIQEKLVRDNPKNFSDQGALGIYHNNLGVLLGNINQPERAWAAHERALEVQQKLVDAQGTAASATDLRDLAGTYINLGVLANRGGDRAVAETAFRKALEIQQTLAREHPHAPDYQNDLAASFNNLGTLYDGAGKPAEAKAALDEALALRENVVRDNPTVTRYRSDLAGTYTNLGNHFYNAGQNAPAAAFYQKALNHCEKLANDHPTVVGFIAGAGGSHVDLGNVRFEERKFADALASYDQAIIRLKDVYRPEHPDRAVRHYLRTAHWGRATSLVQLGRPAESLADWDRAIEIDDGSIRPQLRLGRAETLARTGQHQPAATEAGTLAGQMPARGVTLYDLARVYSLAAAAALQDVKLPSTERDALAGKYVEQAITLLTRANTQGFFKAAEQRKRLETDKDLDPIRQHPEYRRLLQTIEGERR